MAKKLVTIIKETVDIIQQGNYDVNYVNNLVTKTVVSEARGKKLLAEVLPLVVGYTKKVRTTDQLNTLFDGLMPSNRKYAKLFFDAYLPFEYGSHDPKDQRKKSYGKIPKETTKEQLQKQDEAWQLFLSLDKDGHIDPERGMFGGDFWAWSENNITVKGQPDWLKLLDNAVDNLTNEKKGGVSSEEVIEYLIKRQGINLDTLIEVMKGNGK